ncbi:MAG TPA: response regulator transcription factor, partial [Anaerolineae bacterium]|nr:response regulator transcription factor [Anaerolineae bacterium]
MTAEKVHVPIRLLLAEDHRLMRQGLRALLEDEENIKIVGEAGDGPTAVAEAERLQPDIVLMDITMPHLNGLDATIRIRQRCPNTRVIILSMHENEEFIFQALRVGASGYLLKKSASSELHMAVEAVSRGEWYLTPAVSRSVIEEYIRRAEEGTPRSPYERLTSREREVLQLVAEGYTNREIAERLHISIKTVDKHRTSLMSKLDIHDSAGLVRYAVSKGLV